MDRNEFRERFEEMGFDVSVDEDTAHMDDPCLVAENESGDKVWWSILQKSDDWGLYFETTRLTLDSPGRRPREVAFENGSVVVENVTGTASKDFGYGRSAFEGTFRMDKHNAEVTQTVV